MYIGIDIGGSHIKGIVTDSTGKELAFQEIVTPATAKDLENDIYKLVEALTTTASISKIDIKAMGIGSPGIIDKNKGVIVQCANLPFIEKYPIVKKFEKKMGIKTVLEKDSTVALIGGWWKGHGSKFSNWVLVTIGTGIGGGIIIDDKIYSGANGNAMEIGHMIIDCKGRTCTCGNKGCWEEYASSRALIRYAHELYKNEKKSILADDIKNNSLTAKAVYSALLKDDQLAKSAFKEFIYYISIGIQNLITIFNPEAISLGGGLSESQNILIPEINAYISACTLQKVKILPLKAPKVIPSLGAARVAMDA